MLLTLRAGGHWVLAKATAVVTFSRPVRSVLCRCCVVTLFQKMEGFVEDVSTTNPEAYSASLANVVFCFHFFKIFKYILGPMLMAYVHQGRGVSTYSKHTPFPDLKGC